MTDLILAIVGLAILLLAGDALVRGAVALSLRLGVPATIVGLTVVAFGTSAPELLVSVQSALEGAPGIALGNVVGSNIANVLLVLGVPALMSHVGAANADARRSFVQMLGASVVLIALCALGPLHFWHAAALLALFGAMLWDAFQEAKNGRRHADEEAEALDVGLETWKLGLLLFVGIVGLPLGAQLLIDGAVGISRALAVSEEVIGLTLVALGTSLPELATSFMAAIRRETDVAIGNVIGSNLFNILFILGVTSLFGPLPVEPGFLMRDLWIMLAASLALVPAVFFGRRLTRTGGALFLLAYVAYTYVLFHY